MHHFIAMDELKLKLQSENAQFGSKSPIYCPVWPQNWKSTVKLKVLQSTINYPSIATWYNTTTCFKLTYIIISGLDRYPANEHRHLTKLFSNGNNNFEERRFLQMFCTKVWTLTLTIWGQNWQFEFLCCCGWLWEWYIHLLEYRKMNIA